MSKKKKVYEEHMMTGAELMDANCYKDSKGNKLYSFTKYNVEFYHDTGTYTVLSENDKYRKTKRLQYMGIKMMGGLIGWVDYGIKMGIKEASDSKIMLWEYNFLMNYFADRDEFEDAQYLKEELAKYEEHLKTSEQE